MNRFSEEEISEQESLTPERLAKISNGYNMSIRPEGSLVMLMNCAKEYIQKSNTIYPNDADELDVLVHNKISMDGAFMKFCEDTETSIKALHTDAITSWKSDSGGHEHFVGVGIFEVTRGDLRFWHCGLFHKGNQNEDEVSFFIVVDKKQLHGYIGLRNEFDEWQTARDRAVLEIEVIGGNSIPYEEEADWDDLFLPDELKKEIIQTFDGFFASEETYKKLKVQWRIGLGFWGPQGCGKSSCLKTLMAKYPRLKPITVQPGHGSPDEILEEAFQYAASHAPALVFFEDVQEWIQTIDRTHFLQLLSGVNKIDGIITVITGNDFSDLEDNIKSRPGRFDKFFKFPLPDKELSKRYLTKSFGDILSTRKINSLATKTVKNSLTYSHLESLYFTAVSIAIPDGRETPTEKDVEEAFEQVIASKEFADDDLKARSRSLTDNYGGDYEEQDGSEDGSDEPESRVL